MKIAAIAGILGLTVAANATFYTSEASFLAAIDATFYLEDFSNFTFGSPLDGSQTSWAAPGANGFGWTASAALGLYSNTSALSTNTANDPLTLTFSGSPVRAFGGKLSNTDISGAFIPGTVTMTLSNGDTQNIVTTTDGFLGWVGPAAVTSVTLSATSGATNNWVQVDHAYTGTVSTVPEPATMAVLGLGALAMLRRRKKA